MSGLLVWMGLNGPRISRGASGFMSQVSNWLGAPRLKMRMQDLSDCCGLTAPAALRPAKVAIEKPRAPSVPTWRKSRRVKPSQVVTEPFPVTCIIAAPAQDRFEAPVTIAGAP